MSPAGRRRLAAEAVLSMNTGKTPARLQPHAVKRSSNYVFQWNVCVSWRRVFVRQNFTQQHNTSSQSHTAEREGDGHSHEDSKSTHL